MRMLPGLVEGLDPAVVSSLRVQLDWLHYKANFREPVSVRRAVDAGGMPLQTPTELAIDLRQIDPAKLHEPLAAAIAELRAEDGRGEQGKLYLDRFTLYGDSLIWRFNQLFWERLAAWEAESGRGFEAALPAGASDANHPEAIRDSVADFWTLLRDLDTAGQLPPENFALEIGVGSGTRAKCWLDAFKALDEQCGTGYYPRLRFLLGDYSPATLDTALSTVGPHAPLVSVLAMDAQNPVKTLAFLKFKVLYIHLTNVYDNLPFEEMVQYDGRVFLAEVRPYISRGAACRLLSGSAVNEPQFLDTMHRLLDVGPASLGLGDQGVAFWRCLWSAIKLEERWRELDQRSDDHLPRGLRRAALDDLLAATPYDVRFHLSRGAAESFANTIPLLHPRGYLQVQDIFVTSMDEYRRGFRGPGKLDGSIVTWVNGALLTAVGARAGYDVHFAPFPYRAGSRTAVLYTTTRP